MATLAWREWRTLAEGAAAALAPGSLGRIKPFSWCPGASFAGVGATATGCGGEA